MKKTIKKVTVVVLIFVMLLFTACTDGDFGETERKARERLELSLSKCLGTCLTREEMAQLIYNF